jgi:hypothetical protein
VVENKQIIAADLEVKLMNLGYAVIGTEAIQMAEQLRPELALMVHSAARQDERFGGSEPDSPHDQRTDRS